MTRDYVDYHCISRLALSNGREGKYGNAFSGAIVVVSWLPHSLLRVDPPQAGRQATWGPQNRLALTSTLRGCLLVCLLVSLLGLLKGGVHMSLVISERERKGRVRISLNCAMKTVAIRITRVGNVCCFQCLEDHMTPSS